MNSGARGLISKLRLPLLQVQVCLPQWIAKGRKHTTITGSGMPTENEGLNSLCILYHIHCNMSMQLPDVCFWLHGHLLPRTLMVYSSVVIWDYLNFSALGRCFSYFCRVLCLSFSSTQLDAAKQEGHRERGNGELIPFIDWSESRSHCLLKTFCGKKIEF